MWQMTRFSYVVQIQGGRFGRKFGKFTKYNNHKVEFLESTEALFDEANDKIQMCSSDSVV